MPALGLALGLPYGRKAAGVPANSAEAQQYFNRLVPYPAPARETILADFIDALVAVGLDDVFDFLYIATAAEASTALTNVFQTPYQQVQYQATSGLVFTADSGWAGGSAGHHLSSTFDPAIASSPRFVRDDAMILAHIGSTTTINQPAIFQATNAAPSVPLPNIELWPRYTDGKIYTAVNGVEFDVPAGADTSGTFIVQRTASNLTTVYRNNVSMGTGAGASIAVPAGPIRFGFGAHTLRIMGAGKSMTSPQRDAFETAKNTLLTAIVGSLP